MASTYKPGARPKNFAPFAVKFTAPDGESLAIPGVVFKYRTRKEYGALVDSTNAKGENSYKPVDGEKFSLEKFLEAMGKNVVALLLESIDSWGLEIAVTEDGLAQMLDETPAAIQALNECYASAARDGRLGN